MRGVKQQQHTMLRGWLGVLTTPMMELVVHDQCSATPAKAVVQCIALWDVRASLFLAAGNL